MSLRASDIKLVKYSGRGRSKIIEAFLSRPSLPPQAEKTALEVIEAVRKQGDRAVRRYVKKFDHADLKPAAFRISEAEIDAAVMEVDAAFKKAAREAHRRVSRFAKAGLRPDWEIKAPRGGTLGERFLPLDRVGVYVPGGTAPLASTAIHTITLARCAGVPEIAVFTPCDPKGRVNPYILFAARLAGATEVYRIGGIPCIAAAAWGTETIAPVQKIVGPGNAWVTAAKKGVYGKVAIDMLAGPSEIAVLADDSIPPKFVAADLLSQAEHGSGLEKSLLVTDSMELARAVRTELLAQAKTLSRNAMVEKVLKQGTILAVSPDLDVGAELVNRFAPEHFELLVRRPKQWLPKITTAGAIFIGPWTPESAGDFTAGPSHVLPTGGTAAMFAGLTVDDFRRRSSVIHLTKADLAEMLPTIEAFGRVEGLDAHVRSPQIRFEE